MNIIQKQDTPIKINLGSKVQDLLQLRGFVNTDPVIGFKDITIEQLLLHTSGLLRHVYTDEVVASPLSNATVPLTRTRTTEYIASQPLLFTPGFPNNVAYSNVGYLLLGMIAQRVSNAGTTYFDMLRNRILTPLGIARAPQRRDLGSTAAR